MYGINNIRFGGIASGLDTESIIKDLMKIEQIKVDRNVQQKQLLEWKRDDYRDINTKLLALRNSTFDLKLQGTFMTKKVNSSDETCLTATAGAEAVEGSYHVEVLSLASGVTAASSEKLGSGETKTTLKDQFTGIADTVSFTLENKFNGETKTQTFTFNTTEDSIYDIIRSINESDIGIKASYDEGTDRFFLMTTNTGSDANITVKGDSEAFLRDTLKLYTGDAPAEETPVKLGTGTDAEIKFNGITGLTFSSNQFTFNNINFNLKKAEPGNIVDLSVSYNTDAVVDKIKSFVENYNTIMENINTKLSEKRYRDFPPLTAEQKKDMDEKDIELWEEKARSGLFRADSMLSGIASDLRTATGSAVNGLTGDYKALSSIGISTGAWYDQGKLYVDETKLKKALTDDPEGVMKIFTNSSEIDSETGIAQKLYDNITHAMEQVSEKAGKATTGTDQSFLGKQISDLDNRIEEMEDRLFDIETRYWNQFTAMEKALQQMQSQSNWLTAQLGGLQ